MIKEAIILAGGKGTRLQTAVQHLPKCLAPVNGIPFINFIITFLKNQGIEKFIFSLGYKSDMVIQYVDDHFKELCKTYVIENEPLGTGGAIKKAIEFAHGKDIIVINGDTIFNINLADLSEAHHLHKEGCTIALKELKNFDRYGAVEFNTEGIITGFAEKKFCSRGFINAGIYALNILSFKDKNLPEQFSFEKEYLEKFVSDGRFYGIPFQHYFIDIGIPEDYKKFEQEYSNAFLTGNNKTADSDFGILLETIGAFFELLD